MSDSKLTRKVKKLINKPDEFFADSHSPTVQQLGNLWKWRARQDSGSAASTGADLKGPAAKAAQPKPETASKVTALLTRAGKEYVAGNLQRALELYLDAAALAPDNSDAVAGEAACRFLLGQYGVASELFDGLVTTRPASADYRRAAELSRWVLAEQSSPTLRSNSLLVMLETSTHKAVKGWILSDGSREKVSVALFVDGQPAGSQLVELKRRQPAKGLTLVDFTFALSRDVSDGAEHELAVSLEARAHHVFGNRQRRIVSGQLKVGEFSVSYGYVRGTIWPQAFLQPGRAHQPQQTTVNVMLDGALVRALVVKFVWEDGVPQLAQFSFKLPMTVNDGKAHQLRVAVPDLGTELPTADGLEAFVLQELICGQIEQIKQSVLTGWVFDVSRPGESLEVSLFDGDAFVESKLTHLARADVNQAFGTEGSQGFSFQLPTELCDGRGHYLRVYVGSHRLPSSFDDQPVMVDRADLLASPRRFQGNAEVITSERVVGWAADLAAPNRPVHVMVRVGGVAVATVLANQFSARVKNAGKGSGHHWFYIALPTRLMNGKSSQVDVTIVESPGVVIGKATVNFPLVDYFGSLPRWPSFEPGEPDPKNGNQVTQLAFEAIKPVISLIVLNLDGEHLLPGLFDSLAQVVWNVPIEIIFIDHGSTDQSLALATEAERRLPMRVIARNANYSFSESNNFGAGLARGEYLAFVNNDIVFQNDCLTPLCAHFADASVGLAGLRLVEPLLGPDGEMKLTPHHVAVKLAPSLVAEAKHGRLYMPLEIASDDGAAPGCRDVPAVTAALSVCRKSDFLALHGFDEGYFYGLEDVDLCHKFQFELGKRVICDTRVSAIHQRSATRNRAKKKASSASTTVAPVSAMENRERYVARFGRKFTRDILLSLIRGQTFWRKEPLQVTFAVTEADINTAAGDFFTALELGEALREEFGYKVMFVTMGSFELPGTDVLIVMRHDYNVRKITNANPGLITVAWIRNRVDQWLGKGQLDAYHALFCSSQAGADEIFERTGRAAALLPIATNPKRFRPLAPQKHLAADVTFTGHFWGSNRDGLEMIDPARIDGTLAIFGQGWNSRPAWHRYWRGQLPYVDLPEVYASTSIVIDDSHPVTRRWGSLNSRVFDALGAGKLVLTNCREGAQAMFGDRLPTYATAEELEGLINHYLHQPAEREALASSLHQEVLARHTYNHRARALKSGLEGLLTRGLRFALKVPIPKPEEKERWGDYHFALGIQRALEARGHTARIDLLPDWKGGLSISDDVVLVLRGLSQFEPTPRSLNLMWLISHPTEVAYSEYEKFDHVFVASQLFAKQLGDKLNVPVSQLLQCTDPTLFSPRPAPDSAVPRVLFVGNSRNQKRPIIRDCVEANIDVGVYGSMWERLIPERLWRGQHISNRDLAGYYSNAKVVLNDHWPDMARHGFISNRIFDAGACNATIVTDRVEGLDDLFGGLVHSYEGSSQLSPLVERLAADDAGRAERGATLGDLIRREHTFGHRVDAMLRVVERLRGHNSVAAENGSSTRSVSTAGVPREHAAPAIGVP